MGRRGNIPHPLGGASAALSKGKVSTFVLCLPSPHLKHILTALITVYHIIIGSYASLIIINYLHTKYAHSQQKEKTIMKI